MYVGLCCVGLWVCAWYVVIRRMWVCACLVCGSVRCVGLWCVACVGLFLVCRGLWVCCWSVGPCMLVCETTRRRGSVK